MPNVLLPVPHFEQSKDGMCLPACARMILAYWQNHLPEKKLARLLKTDTWGTPISNIRLLSKLKYQVEFDFLNTDKLKNHLDQGEPVIARVWTTMLSYWTIETSHVIVVAGYDDGNIYLNDPAFSNAPQTEEWNGFLAAWAEFDETAAVIRPIK